MTIIPLPKGIAVRTGRNVFCLEDPLPAGLEEMLTAVYAEGVQDGYNEASMYDILPEDEGLFPEEYKVLDNRIRITNA